MKKSLLTLLFVAIALLSANAVNVKNLPVMRIQPNGDTLRCFATGDEYYHRLHDANGYTIVQHPTTGYYVYALQQGDSLVASNLIVGRSNPSTANISVGLRVSSKAYAQRLKAWEVPEQYRKPQTKTDNTNRGTLNNIVVFIRFSDDSNISTTYTDINTMFNDSASNAVSMYNYFKHASYQQLYIPTTYYPAPSGDSILSYQDIYPRSYYCPYNATTNPSGYTDDSDRRTREFSLLERAVNYINLNSPVPTSLNIDMDNDSYVDNVCFIVKGTYTAWNNLLWPHKWSLYDRSVYINGKRVYTYNLQLEGSGSHYFSTSTFCHEMFHTLGAPDLYHYNYATDIHPAGSWDLMEYNQTPPQHPSAYMKYRYGNWIDNIPTITIPGTYTLQSLANPSNSNNCYKIPSQDPNQYYVLEYRNNDDLFETALPGKGLLIWRIDTRYSGNANFNDSTIFDEVWLYRPNGNNSSSNGNYASAYFSGSTSRTSFSATTNPSAWLTGNVVDSAILISNIGIPNSTISFTYSDLRGCVSPYNLAATNLTGSTADLQWTGNANTYVVRYHAEGSSLILQDTANGNNHTLHGLSLNTRYHWSVTAHCSDTDTSAPSSWHSFKTTSCLQPIADTLSQEDISYYQLPINNYYNYTYTQQIYTAAEIGTELNISKIMLNYSGSNPSNRKDSCIIYMGHTSQTSFPNTQSSSFVAHTTLQPVYHGHLNCDEGWNTFVLDSIFAYNGTDNLVVAVYDYSHSYNGPQYTFYATNTPNRYSSLTYFSDSQKPIPSSLNAFTGSKQRYEAHCDICFIGCQPTIDYSVVLTTSPLDGGSVEGAGSYPEGSTVTLSAIPSAHYHFLRWNDDNTNNPRVITLTSDTAFTAFFAIDTFSITVSSQWIDTLTHTADQTAVQGEGSYPYGTEVRLLAISYCDSCHFVRWDDHSEDNPRTLILTADTQLVAYFIQYPTIGVEEASIADAVIQVSHQHIALTTTQPTEATLYDLVGRPLQQSAKNTVHHFYATSAGVYLLRFANRTIKVVVY